MKHYLNEAIKKAVNETILNMVNNTHGIREVKYFHPSGKGMPNGSHYQKGGYLSECRKNLNSFILTEAVHGEQYGMSKYHGGIIVFSADANAIQMSDNKFINKIKQFLETHKQRRNGDKILHYAIVDSNNGEYIGAYSLGNFFKGKYAGDNGERFDEKSLSIEINGLSSKSLLRLGELIAKKFRQKTILIKDLNKNKIYLADANPSDDACEDDLDNINTEC